MRKRKSRMSERDIGQEILDGVREIKEHKAGVKTLRTHKLKRPAVHKDIRAKRS
jgi:putative transcriptional regulator